MVFVARLKALAAGGWQRMFLILTSLILVVMAGWTAARLVWLAVEGPARPITGTQEVLRVGPSREYTPEMAREWRLFGRVEQAPALPRAGEKAPDTRLSLQLLGTFSVHDEKLAGAIIAERGRDGELYRIGAAIPGGATLERVNADHVLLRYRGQLEALRFEQLAGAAVSPVDTVAKAGSSTLGGFRSVRDRVSGSAATTSQPADARQLLGRLESELKSNPEGALEELGLQPSASGVGYQVGTGTPAEAMRNLGLRPGDIILSVNGNALGDVRRDAQLVDEVRASGEARVEIKRGSQTFTVNYPL